MIIYVLVPHLKNKLRQQEFYQKIAGMVANSGSFQNFADPSLRNGEWQKSYYGNNYSRLQRIKRDLDPGNFLQYEQSIRPA